MTTYSLLIILGCGLVTWLLRVIPFILVRKIQLPEIVIQFLSYIPLCILTALFVQNLFIAKQDEFPELNVEYCLAAIPTIFIAILTKNLMWIVIVGMCSMAAIRYFLV
ncbi:AzlD domain-containing protein [Gilliamella sp. B2776]|uniref:AzlD domain-containing protein n=1 Tax=unclassified Gilliamella TaxID=2685620 RepID=UPI002269C558|nr:MULTISPECIES: AzlD domain-containing protein [unclassified Gilliamella]MCX8650454.1 AzlD domain-containing protein [Gilliamella sp. B2779]MCX8654500.1 AzlD domain-containing protein [Gilliamella sp. B2737]MCX8656759.1 AzlD domain-containing protein [Gilliamella sp. B2894]MCX8665497.1 AzlD domain-containing protein [Gilliamella sp. B2887]MCX8692302.1 AzlD domain-containing protein [Gilliamella sp. B2776]